MISLLREATRAIKLRLVGIDPDMVGVHSLRLGGEMVLKLHGHIDTIIMKIGRWSGLTFLQYIHNQIARLAKDMPKKMSTPHYHFLTLHALLNMQHQHHYFPDSSRQSLFGLSSQVSHAYTYERFDIITRMCEHAN